MGNWCHPRSIDQFIYRASQSNKPLVVRINNPVPGDDIYYPAQQVSYLTRGGLQDNEWHHLGFTIDRDGQIILYIDGLAVRAMDSVKQGDINPTTPFYIGRAHAGPNNSNLRGKIDEIRVYQFAISPADMFNQYYARDNGCTVMSLIGENNQLLADERQSFVYDGEGNRIQRVLTIGMAVDDYTWDHRNRLTSVSRTGPRELAQFDFESDHGDWIIDYLGSARRGFLENGAYLVDTGKHGQHTYAVSFDGSDDFGNLGIQDLFYPTTHGFTLTSWFHPEYKTTDMTLVAFGGISGNEVGYALTMKGSGSPTSDSELTFTVSDGSGSSQSALYMHSGSLLGEWHHVAVTIDGVDAGTRYIRMYLDGELVESEELTETVPFGTVLQPFVLGASAGGSSNFFSGMLDDIRVVGYPLDEDHFEWMMENAYPETVNILQADYTYDHQNRLISRTIDPDGDAGPADPITEYFVHDGVISNLAGRAGRVDSTSPLANPDAALVPSNLNEIGQIALRLTPDGQVMNRYLWSDQVDQLLAQESVAPATSGPQSAGEVDWSLTDHLGTIRDLVRYDSGEDEVVSVLHRAYDSFGNVSNETTSDGVDLLFGFTGRYFDAATELQNNLNRWYDAVVGRWVSEDLMGFQGGSWNLSEYLGGAPIAINDPTGLFGPRGTPGFPGWPYPTPPGPVGPPKDNRKCAPTCVDRALKNSQFGKDVKNDHYKHCKRSCELQKECGTVIATALGWGKEAWDVIGSGDADVGDLLANHYGRQVGANGGDCTKQCADKYPPGQTRKADPGWF